MDERQTNPAGAFSRHIGLYLASISAPGFNKTGGTDIYFMDLYIGLYFNKLSIQSELLLRRGKSGDKNIIDTGSYTGTGSSDGPEINLGWEPQWVIIKGTGTVNWAVFDHLRGVASKTHSSTGA